MKYKITKMRMSSGNEPYVYFVWLKESWFKGWQRCRSFHKPELAEGFKATKPTTFEIDKEVPYP